jgi:hypothetical protein
VIDELSLALRRMLTESGLPGLAEAAVAFDRPGETFTPGQTTLNLFLFDIRENRDLRCVESDLLRTEAGLRRSPAPLRVACSYLLTAWPVGGAEMPLQEHFLLGEALVALARHPTIPPEFLGKSLAAQTPPLPMVVARSDGPKDPAEFWTAIGGRLRPSLTVTATIGLPLAGAETLQVVTATTLRLGLRAGAVEPAQYRIGGQVRDAAGQPAPGAEVWLEEIGMVARADAEGRYAIGPLPAGRYTLTAGAEGAGTTAEVAVPPAAGQGAAAYDLRLAAPHPPPGSGTPPTNRPRQP